MSTFEEYATAEGLVVKPYHQDERLFDIVSEFYVLAAPLINLGSHDGAPMVIDVYSVDEPGLNAFAGTFDDADVIGINRGTYSLLVRVARGLVSQGNFLPRVGKSEMADNPRRSPLPIGEMLMADSLPDDLPLSNMKREKLAIWIGNLSMIYILSHEFSHIFNGHTSWMEEAHGLRLINEIQANGTDGLDGFERETLEWDADVSSFQFILGLAIQTRVTVVEGRGVWEIPERNLIGTPQEAIACVMAAVSICAWFFAIYDPSDPRDPAPRSHPHPVFRLLSCYHMIIQSVGYRTGRTVSEAQDFIDHDLLTFPRALAEYFSENTAPIHEDLIPCYLARIDAYSASWKMLHKSLDRLKRGGVLAPSEPGPHPSFLDRIDAMHG